MSNGFMRSVGYQNIQPEFQSNSRGLRDVIRLVALRTDPLLTAILQPSLFPDDNWYEILTKGLEADVLNTIAKRSPKGKDDYKILESATDTMDKYLRRARDIMPPRVLVLSAAIDSATTTNTINVVDNGEYIALRGTRLRNPRTGEVLLVDNDASGNTNISVRRGASNSTPAAMNAGDVLLDMGIHKPMFGEQSLPPKPLPKRLTTLVNGWVRFMTPGTPLLNNTDEETLYYGLLERKKTVKSLVSQFSKLDLMRTHREQLANILLFGSFGSPTYATVLDDANAIGNFQGLSYWASLNTSASFAVNGALTKSAFENLMTWWEVYENMGVSENKEMLYFCGSIAFKALQTHARTFGFQVLNTDQQGNVPDTVGSRITRYRSPLTSKVVSFIPSSYLDQIGQQGTIFMFNEGNVEMIVGRDNFLMLDCPAAVGSTGGYYEGAARLIDIKERAMATNNQVQDCVISQFSILPKFIETCAIATGITSAIV